MVDTRNSNNERRTSYGFLNMRVSATKADKSDRNLGANFVSPPPRPASAPQCNSFIAVLSKPIILSRLGRFYVMPYVSRRVPGRYPAPSTSPIADKIRQRRGERGLTPLDGTLLHVPPIANGWNELLGAVRTQGKLRSDVRELMVCIVTCFCIRC